MSYNDAAVKAETETGARIWIGGLPEKVSEAQLRSKFERFGTIVWIRIRSSSRDVYAFIQFAEAKEARLACYEMDQNPDFGAGRGGVMKVSMAKPTEAEAQLLKHAGRCSPSPRRVKDRSHSRQRYRSPSPSRSRSRSRGSSSRKSPSPQKDRRSASRKNGDRGRGDARARQSRSRSALPRLGKGNDGGKGEGKGKHKSKAIRVRIENLPPDFTEKEMRDLGSGFGRLVHVRIWSYQTRTFANLMYDDPDEAMKALCALHDRKVAGWSETLKAQIPCPHCDATLWE